MYPLSKRKIRAAVIHCTATPARRKVTMQDIHQWHVVERGWSAPGYHFLICRDGSIDRGRDLDRDGAHARTNGYNRNTIGIALAGGIGRNNQPEPNYTRAQWRSLKWLLKQLEKQYPDMDVLGHRDTGANKACPCFDVRHWMKTGEVRV